LNAAGIQIFTGVSGKVRNAIEGYKKGQYKTTPNPTVSGHHGIGMSEGSVPGKGRGMGMGGGGGIRYMGPSDIAPDPFHTDDAQKDFASLKSGVQALEKRLDSVIIRIEALEKKKEL